MTVSPIPPIWCGKNSWPLWLWQYLAACKYSTCVSQILRKQCTNRFGILHGAQLVDKKANNSSWSGWAHDLWKLQTTCQLQSLNSQTKKWNNNLCMGHSLFKSLQIISWRHNQMGATLDAAAKRIGNQADIWRWLTSCFEPIKALLAMGKKHQYKKLTFKYKIGSYTWNFNLASAYAHEKVC